MKKLATILVLVFGLVGVASAQHRGGGQHNGGYNNGHQHNSHNVQRHGGYGWVAPLMLGAGVAYLVSRQQPVYYQQPIVVETTLPVQCSYVQQHVTDPQGRPLYDRYTGQPLIRMVSFCPAPVE